MAWSSRDPTLDLGADGAPLAAIWLRVESGETEAIPAARTPLAPGEEIVLGSSKVAPMRVIDPAISGRHCRVVHRGDSIEVLDLGSRNGVRVGGVRVQQARLHPGGAFEIGHTLVRVDAARMNPVGDDAPPLKQLVGRSRVMCQLAASVRKVAPLRLPVLLRGESGTGKDLIAQAVHEESDRRRGPFVALNCATISRELAESELFGHKRGAFTGALRDRRGAFQAADGGTLFLDEIATMSPELQAKMLRVVEEGVVRPLGTDVASKVDVRLVVATCEPLEALVSERLFRADLYERLAVCRLLVPPLRERDDDIPLLARHLLEHSEIGACTLSPGALAALRAHRWSGNVRELRNVLVQAALLADGGSVLPEHISAVLVERAPPFKRRVTPADALKVFEEVGGNISAAARRAEMPRTTMRDLLRAAGAL
ncbi:sigma 54-dependent Fis family transcriptional regulator [Chondromyces apiculatus]|uniref:sigma 54-dependent Fis family transcriptional regulator n=1 Tax=Chondromyces apiculatus TaxID=51 RepID=UPI001E646612|nr:sigma 54-dependent Fis family transcriptional regulator [Chondromyces apiculatus]